MTLELKLKEVSGAPSPAFIYVDGGQSGSLRLSAKKFPQIIKCSKKAHLNFLICGNKSQSFPLEGDVYAQRDFWAESTIDQKREVWGDGKNHQYKMEYYNERHEKIGYLTFDVTYNKGLFYQGELQGVDKTVPRNLLPFYKQKCPTYNLYNCLDSGNQGHTFNFVEDIYRDA